MTADLKSKLNEQTGSSRTNELIRRWIKTTLIINITLVFLYGKKSHNKTSTQVERPFV